MKKQHFIKVTLSSPLVAEILLKEVEEAEFDPVGPSRSQCQEAATK